MLNHLISTISTGKFNLSIPDITLQESTVFILILAFGLLSKLELHSPREKHSRKEIRQSQKANFSLFIFNNVVMSILSVTSILMIARNHFWGLGLLSGIANPMVKATLSFLALDLLLYVWHRICHRFDSLWMFHKVHHNDPYLNVSTGFRIHIVELMMTHFLKGTLIIALGIDEFIVLLNELVTTLFVMLHHTNTSFKAEKWIGRLFITPYLHRTHHSVQRHEHDSNYGAILSLWDRLFRTLSEAKAGEIGIKGSSPQDLINLLKFGFTPELPAIPQAINLDAMIAVAAYYKAEKRNFLPGYEMRDWMEAKQELTQMFYSNSKVQSQPVKKDQRGYVNWLNQTLHLNFMN